MADLLTHGWSRVAVLAGTVCALLAALLVAPAAAEHYEDVREVSAGDGVAAAAAYSKLAFPTGAANALLGRADVFADSLASGVLQNDRPLLLTNNFNLSAPTKDELARLKVGTVTILGGLSAVSSNVEQELKDLGYRVNRLNGPTRIETAIEVAKASAPGRTALLARGFGSADPTSAFADSLAAGGWAAEKDLPILLTESEKLSQPTADFLRGRIDQLFVVGGRAAVSDAVLTQARALGVAVTRISGTNRFETAVAIAKARGFATAANASEVVLVDGQGANAWTDGFAVAAYAGRNKAPVVLANSAASSLPAATSTFLNAGPQADLLAGWTVPAAQVTQAAEGMDKDAVTTRVMQVQLHGDNVVRKDSAGEPPIWGHGVRGKTGLLTMTIDEEKNSIDYTFESQLTGPYHPVTPDNSGLVIRKAALNARGLVALVRFPELQSTGKSSGTVTRSAYATGFHVRDLIQNPTAHYAEASLDTSHRDGAIRGQLPSGGTSHLPGKPTFSAITTSAGDNWITLKFAAPVYTNQTISLKDDFSVTVDGVPVNLQDATATHDIPTTATGAKDTFILKLPTTAGSPVPVENKETVVTITQAGVGKLMNNLGDKVAAAPVSIKQITPADTTDPAFTGIQVNANSDLVRLNFSEPVHHGALELNATFSTRDVQVQFVQGGTATAVSADDLPLRDKSIRTRELTIKLASAVPLNNEVRVTLANNAVGGSAPIRDAANRKVAGVFTHTAAPTAGAGFSDVAATDVVAGVANDQTQTVTMRLVEGLPNNQAITVTVPTSGIAYNNNTASAVSAAPAVAGLAVTPVTNNVATITAPTGIPGGTLITLNFRDVDVSANTETPASGLPSLSLAIRRTDTGTQVTPTFDRRRGAVISSTPAEVDLVAGKPNLVQVIKVQVRGANLAKNGVISLDLRDLASNGVTYSAAAVPTGSKVRADWVGGAKERLDLTVTDVGGVTTGDTLTVDLNATVPGSAPYAMRSIRIARTDATGERTASNVAPALVKPALDAFSVGNIVSAPGQASGGYGSGKVQEMSVKLWGDLRAGASVQFALANQVLPAPLGGQPRIRYSTVAADVARIDPDTSGTLLVTQGAPAVVKLTAPTGGIASGSVITLRVSNIDTRRALSGNIAAEAERSDGGTKLTGVNYSVTGAPANTLERVVFANSTTAGNGPKFGDDVGDSLTLTFTTAPTVTSAPPASASSVTFDGVTLVVACGNRTVCQARQTPDTHIVDMTVTAPFLDGGGQSEAVALMPCHPVSAIANWGPNTFVSPNAIKVGTSCA